MFSQRAPGGNPLLGFSAHPGLKIILFMVVLIAYLLTGGQPTHHPAICAKPQLPFSMYFSLSVSPLWTSASPQVLSPDALPLCPAFPPPVPGNH